MAVDAFLKMEVKGDSVAKGQEGSMDVLSWHWGMTQTGTTHRSTGGGAGKVNVEDLSVTKYVDSATPNLVAACCTGKHFGEAVLTVRKAGGTPLDYLVITMTDVIVSGIHTGGSKGEELVTETVTLNFAKFKESYQPQDNKGAKSGGAIEASYDIAKNS
jgi:type VI secretion system secreted protein Hcp